MKKILLALVGIAMAFGASAAQFSEGDQYVKLDKSITGVPQGL